MRRTIPSIAIATWIVIATVLGCREQRATPQPVDAALGPSPARTTVDGDALVASACLACHGKEMILQQRLTKAQWTSVVKKMVGWGAPLEPSETEPLVDYLARSYGPDAGPFVPLEITSDEASGELAAIEDGPFSNGDATRGKGLFGAQCAGCHAPNAGGDLGVNLVDRPILQRARDLAAIVRSGRGKMNPIRGVSDSQIGDIVAYLRTLSGPR